MRMPRHHDMGIRSMKSWTGKDKMPFNPSECTISFDVGEAGFRVTVGEETWRFDLTDLYEYLTTCLALGRVDNRQPRTRQEEIVMLSAQAARELRNELYKNNSKPRGDGK